MATSILRRRIAARAAELLFDRQQSDFFRARAAAAQQLCPQPPKAYDLPGTREIWEHLPDIDSR